MPSSRFDVFSIKCRFWRSVIFSHSRLRNVVSKKHCCTAFVNSSRLRFRTITTPIEDPWCGALTTNGKPILLIKSVNIFERSATCHSSRVKVIIFFFCPVTSEMSLFCIGLSIPTAEPISPGPRYGIPYHSSRPCMAPSSAWGPCMMVKAKSMIWAKSVG